MSIVNTIADLKDKVMEWVKSYAAPKTHIETRATDSTLGHVIVDANLKSPSSNPVSGQAIKEALNNIEDSNQVKTNTNDIKALKETLAYYQKIIGEPTSIEVYRSYQTNETVINDEISTTKLMIDKARKDDLPEYNRITIRVRDKNNNLLSPTDFQNTRADFFWMINNNMKVTQMGYISDGSKNSNDTETKININLNSRKSDWQKVSTNRYELTSLAGYPLLIFFNEYKNPKYQRSYCLKRITILPEDHTWDGTTPYLTEKQYNLLN